MRGLGVDIGGSSVKVAIVEDGRVVSTRQSESYSQPNAARLTDALRQALGECSDAYAAAGICVPGLFDRALGCVVHSVNLPGLDGLPLTELIHRASGPRIARLKIVNDAIATAVDIVASEGISGRVLCLALGTGIGAAVLDDAKPLIIEGDSSGHIGQMDVSLGSNPPIGPDGGAGSLEAYIGAPALVRLYGSIEQFLKVATISDAPLRALARAIRICHAIYRPNHVVLAGGIGIRLRHLIADLKELVDIDLTSIAQSAWTLGTGENDFHAAIGAARLALE